MITRDFYLFYRKLKFKSFSIYCNNRQFHQNLYDVRFYHRTQHMCKEKYTAQLLPEVEKRLLLGEIKHRKHPGVKKEAPITLSPKLIKAVDRVMLDWDVKALLNDSKKLLNHIASRRLPIEFDEVQERISTMLPTGFELDEYTDQNFQKDLQAQVKKRMACELKRWKAFDYTAHLSIVYLVARLAANYASVLKVLSEIKASDPSFKPKTFMDFGSGVGSAVWATYATWGDYVKEYFCVDASSDMNDLCQKLLQEDDSEKMFLETVHFRQFLPASETLKYDLIVSAFSLMDLSSAMDRLRVIDTLWRKTTDILVIIEPSSNAGFSAVLEARDYIIKLESDELNSKSSSGAHVLSPCPHEFSCPRLQDARKTPCNFIVSYHPLFPKHMSQIVKKEDFTYVVLRRGHRSKDEIAWPRIVKPVLKKSKHVICRACCDDGKINEVIITKARHGRDAYRCARSSSLGDLLPMTVSQIIDDENSNTYVLQDSENENSSNECHKTVEKNT